MYSVYCLHISIIYIFNMFIYYADIDIFVCLINTFIDFLLFLSQDGILGSSSFCRQNLKSY